jgi:hypothetical protein
MVSLIGFACGCGAFQAFLRRFSGVSPAILLYSSIFSSISLGV